MEVQNEVGEIIQIRECGQKPEMVGQRAEIVELQMQSTSDIVFTRYGPN
jgi:hypothetical protein